MSDYPYEAIVVLGDKDEIVEYTGDEVVRCKDCLHGSWCEDVLWCNITDEPMTEDDFCSKGDRI